MKILLVCYEYPPVGGGGGVGASQYAEAWAAQGHDVTVLTSRTSSLPSRGVIGGVEVVRVPTVGKPDRVTSTIVSMASYLVSGFFYVLRHRPSLDGVQVVNTHFSLPTGPLGLFVGRLLGVPQVLTIIGGDIYDPAKRSSPHRSRLLRVLNRYIIRSAHRVIAISSDTEQRARRHYGIRRPVRVINYGFKPLPEPDEPPALPTLPDPGSGARPYRLISVGRLVERKGFKYLIRALAFLPARVQLLLVGDGPLEQELRRMARECGVQDRVAWLGYQPRDRIYGYLKQSDCYVLSSLHEGLGIVVQEAMFAGLPVVATNNGGQVDLIRERRNGLLVEPEDPEALAGAIEEIRNDRALAESMRRNNLTDIETYDVAQKGGEYLTVFEEATRGTGDGTGTERAAL